MSSARFVFRFPKEEIYSRVRVFEATPKLRARPTSSDFDASPQADSTLRFPMEKSISILCAVPESALVRNVAEPIDMSIRAHPLMSRELPEVVAQNRVDIIWREYMRNFMMEINKMEFQRSTRQSSRKVTHVCNSSAKIKKSLSL